MGSRAVSDVLARLEKRSELERRRMVDTSPEDRMLAITEDTGRFYSILLRASRAKRVLEIGTSTGYSALWFADAVRGNGEGAEVVTIEQNPSKIKRARENFEEAGVSDMITVVRGSALGILDGMAGSGERFDFAFIDADKENCAGYFDRIFGMLDAGGIVGTDNMLHPQRYRGMMGRFADHIRTHSNARTVTLDIGNGQELTVKTGR